MINLLPPEEKEKIAFKKRKKITVILGICLVIPLMCLVLLLLSNRFYLLGELNSEKTILEQAKKTYQTPEFLTFKKTIADSNAVIAQLSDFYKKESYITDTLKILAEIDRPENVYITDLALSRDQNRNIKVATTGFSGSRDNLLIFQKNLQGAERIENVAFLPQSWVDSQNVRFYLNFEIKP